MVQFRSTLFNEVHIGQIGQSKVLTRLPFLEGSLSISGH